MQITQLSCANFKSYEAVQLAFSTPVVAFTGPNGSGKTNLLDAIYYLCIGKSYFNPIDQQNFRHGTDYFRLVGHFTAANDTYKVVCTNGGGKRKQLQVNGVAEAKLSDHLGRFPVVMIAPDDVMLINGGSEERRKFLDFLLSFTDRDYLQTLQDYNKLLQQRNRLLKQMADQQRWDKHLLSSYDDQLAPLGTQLFLWRNAFLESFVPLFMTQYHELAQHKEEVDLAYDSPLAQTDFHTLLERQQEKDRVLQRTTKGIHRDDLLFTLHGHELKKYGSQGQKKTYLTALKLAAYSFLEQHTGQQPLLLLDDLFDKLDDERSQHLLTRISQQDVGQVFITDTSAERVAAIFDRLPVQLTTFRVAKANEVSQVIE